MTEAMMNMLDNAARGLRDARKKIEGIQASIKSNLTVIESNDSVIRSYHDATTNLRKKIAEDRQDLDRAFDELRDAEQRLNFVNHELVDHPYATA